MERPQQRAQAAPAPALPRVRRQRSSAAGQRAALAARFGALATAIAEITWIVPMDGLAEDMPQWRAFTGQTADEVRGYGWLDAIHPDDRAAAAAAWAEALRSRAPFSVEYRLRRHDGAWRWMSARGVPVLDPASGAVREWVGLCGDITERRAAAEDRERLLDIARATQAEAERRAAQLDGIIAAMADPLIVFDAHGEVARANAAAEDLFDVSRVPPLRGIPEYLMIRDAADAPLAPERSPRARVLRGEVLSGPTAMEISVSADTPGEARRYEVTGAPLRDAAGHIAGAVCVYRDRTEQRRLERRAQGALVALLAMAETLVSPPGEGSSEGAHASTQAAITGRRLLALARSVLGCDRASITAIEPGTETLRALAVVGLPPEMERQWWVRQRQRQLAGIRLGQGPDPTLMARLRAGEAVVVDMTRPPYDRLPNPYGVRTALTAPMRIGDQLVGLLTLDYGLAAPDYTPEQMGLALAVATLGALAIERDRLLADREAARATALASQQAKQRMDRFLDMASHELRTPLTSLSISLQHLTSAGHPTASGRLSTDELLARQRTLAERARKTLRRLQRLVDELLDVSRAQRGQLDLQIAPFDLTALVREVVEEQREATPARAITLALPDAGRPLTIHGDADRIGQVIINYLTNAIKYAPEDRPIEVALSVTPTGEARVAVRDHGPGLDPAEQARVWEIYYQVAGDGQATVAGLGLGLYISRVIIERHGGRIGVESAPGQGCAFWFTLPAG